MNSSTETHLEQMKPSFFAGTFLMTIILGANYGLFIRFCQCHRLHSPLLHISILALILVATIYSLIYQYAMWMWFVNPTGQELRYSLWPDAASPIFSGILIGGVQITFTYRSYILSEGKFRIITVLLLCLSLAQFVFCVCRSMEILGMESNYLKSKSTSSLYIFPIWLLFVTTSNFILNLLLFFVWNRLKFKFEMPKPILTRFIILIPQTHFIPVLLCQLDLGMLLMRKDGSHIAVDLCLGNLHLLSLLLAMNLTQVGRADRSDKGTSGSRKSHRITLAELNVDIPMNPLSARISRTRLSSDWAETFIHGIETSSTRGESEPTIKECSSSTASITRSHSSDLKAFANDVKTFKVKN